MMVKNEVLSPRRGEILVGESITGGAQAHRPAIICDPFRVIKMEPRLRGCDLKPRRGCQRLAGGERSVTPGKPTTHILTLKG